MLKRIAAVLALLLAVVAQSGQAQFTGGHAVTFVSGGPVTYGGLRVGTYSGTLDGPPISIWCTDFYNYAGNFTGYQTDLSDDTSLEKTRWGPLSGSLDRYRQMSLLTTLFQVGNESEWGFIQYAIWSLGSIPVSPIPWLGPVTPGSPNDKINGYLSWASINYQNYNYDNVYVLTDLKVTEGYYVGKWSGCEGIQGQTSCGKQEFLTGTPTVVPEPATMGLLATGLVGLGLASLRSRRRKNT